MYMKMDSINYRCILPVVSNFFVIPLLAFLIRDWHYLYLEAYYVLTMGSISVIYHLLLATERSFLGYTVDDLRFVDHAFAEGMGGLIISLYFIPKRTRKRHQIEIPLVTILFVSQFVSKTSWALIASLAVSLVVSRFVPHIAFTYQQITLISIGLVITGVAYFYNDKDIYPYAHALWHLLIFLILAGIVWYGRKDIIDIPGPISKGSFILGSRNIFDSKNY